MKCCVATCHVSTAWHLLLKAWVEVGLGPQCSALCGGPKPHGQSEQRLHPGRNKLGRGTFQQAVAHQCPTAFYNRWNTDLSKVFRMEIISEPWGRCITLNEYRPRWVSISSRRTPRLPVNNAICPLEKTLVYPNSPCCSQSANHLPHSKICFPPWGWTASFLRLSPRPTGTQPAASVLHGQHVSLVSWAVWPLPADRVPQSQGLVITWWRFVYNFAQKPFIRITANKPNQHRLDAVINNQTFAQQPFWHKIEGYYVCWLARKALLH